MIDSSAKASRASIASVAIPRVRNCSVASSCFIHKRSPLTARSVNSLNLLSKGVESCVVELEHFWCESIWFSESSLDGEDEHRRFITC